MTLLDKTASSCLGENLKRLRTLRGITQEQAAQAIGVARTTLIAIEKGQRQLKEIELVELADLYREPIKSLLTPPDKNSLRLVRYRKTARSPESQEAIDLLVSLANASRKIEQLNNHCPQPISLPKFPIIKRDIKTQAEDAALSLRELFSVGLMPIHNIFSLLELEGGIRIFSRPIHSSISGIYLHDEELGHCILVNAKHPSTRRSFTVAHELGHAISLSTNIEVYDKAHNDKAQEERFANHFACVFLMPARAVRKQFDALSSQGIFSGHHLVSMADYFEVSVEAMCRRLEDLKLLKSGTYDSIRERGFTPKGSRLTEDEQLKLYLPTQTTLLAADALAKGLTSEEELMELLKLDRIELRKLFNAISYEGLQHE